MSKKDFSNNKKKEEENKNFPKIKNEKLKKIILLYMDYYEIKKIMKESLIKNQNDKINGNYYFLNYEWFNTFLKINNMTNIFDYIINNKIIENINNYDKLSVDQKISNIISNIDKKVLSNE